MRSGSDINYLFCVLFISCIFMSVWFLFSFKLKLHIDFAPSRKWNPVPSLSWKTMHKFKDKRTIEKKVIRCHHATLFLQISLTSHIMTVKIFMPFKGIVHLTFSLSSLLHFKQSVVLDRNKGSNYAGHMGNFGPYNLLRNVLHLLWHTHDTKVFNLLGNKPKCSFPEHYERKSSAPEVKAAAMDHFENLYSTR